MKLLSSPYTEYRISDNEWCEYTPSVWNETRVKNIFKLITDIAPNDNDYELLSLYASIGVRPRKDMEQRGNKSVTTDGYWIVKKGDIIVNKLLAWMGAIGLSEYDGVTSPAYDILRESNQNLDARFYTYLFRTEKSQAIFKKHSRGIMDVRLRLYFDKFGAITVPFPPIAEQKKIAHYLDTKTAQIDRKIDLLTQKATQYSNLKQSLINETVTRGLDKSVPMKDSEIGEIPKHWEVKRLKDLSDIQNSNVDKKSYDDEVPVKLCNYVDVYKNEFIDSSLSFMEATANQSEIKQFTIKKNDVFITKDSETCDDIAIPALATESLDGVLCGYHLARFRMKEKVFLGSYLFRLFQSKSYGFRFVISSKGITRVGLGQSAIADSLTPVPPLSEQKVIADYLDTKTTQIDQIIQTLNTQIEKLKELRKTLINDVVTGKIRVIEDDPSSRTQPLIA
jgi:type I restriction enzyme, S subunit